MIAFRQNRVNKIMSAKQTSPSSGKNKILYQVGARLEAMDFTLNWWVTLLNSNYCFACLVIASFGVFLSLTQRAELEMNFVVAWFTDFSNMFLFCCVVNLFKLVFPSLLLSSPVFCFPPSYIHMKGVFAGRCF